MNMTPNKQINVSIKPDTLKSIDFPTGDESAQNVERRTLFSSSKIRSYVLVIPLVICLSRTLFLFLG